ncbi:hypothetical protein MTO96_031610 [Rhipicephalus appendiculatus]
MLAAPKVAYVVYHDGYRAIVSVKLIKNFEPVTVADCHKNQDIYWKNNVDGGVEEGYYRGGVILLGATFSDLVQKMGKKPISVPDSVFYDAATEEDVTTKTKHGSAVRVDTTYAAQTPKMNVAPLKMGPLKAATAAFKRRVRVPVLSCHYSPSWQMKIIREDIAEVKRRDMAWQRGQKKMLQLRKFVWDTFERLQNPTDCQTARKLLCNVSNRNGLGSGSHDILWCFVAALQMGRTLILDTSKWHYTLYGNSWRSVIKPLTGSSCDSVGIDNQTVIFDMSTRSDSLFRSLQVVPTRVRSASVTVTWRTRRRFSWLLQARLLAEQSTAASAATSQCQSFKNECFAGVHPTWQQRRRI